MKVKKTAYLFFCDECGAPQEIPDYILKTYFVSEVEGIYCKNCERKIAIPDYLKKISGEL
jgi:hypothetical protein